MIRSDLESIERENNNGGFNGGMNCGMNGGFNSGNDNGVNDNTNNNNNNTTKSNKQPISSPTGLLRKKINTLIIIEVHQRDIVDRFVRDSILNSKEFDWESQLRFYWDMKSQDISIQQCTGRFSYGYEY